MIGSPTIRIWPLAHQMYGWDMMASVLVHEFGHLKLYHAEHIYKGLEAEDKANRYGSCHMRNDLIPRNCWLYREFFLPSHIFPGGWDEAKCRAEYEKWITWLKDAPMVRALAVPANGMPAAGT